MMAAHNIRFLLKKLIIIQILRRQLERRQRKCKRSLWMRKIYQERNEKVEFLFDHSFFFKYFRMGPCT